MKGRRSPCGCGFKRCGTSPAKNLEGSALGLQQLLGLGSYQTAWSWLHKLRRAMVRPGRDRLQGCVEVEEDLRGRKRRRRPRPPNARPGDRCRRGGVRRAGDRPHSAPTGTRRLWRQSPRIHRRIGRLGSVVHTDGWKGYDNIAKKSYPPQGYDPQPKRRTRPQTDAPCAPGGVASETLVAGDASRSSEPAASRLLPR